MEAMKVYRRGLERSALVMRGSRTVAEVFTDREPGDQYETAALFAAAPALLESLRDALACIDEIPETERVRLGLYSMQWYGQARAAIARATGIV